MKHSIFTAVLLSAFFTAAHAQSPVYIQFEPSCMNQLEYQYTYSGQNLLMYSIAKNDNELYFFLMSDLEPSTTPYPPKSAYSCSDAPLTKTLIDGINAGGRLAYIVFRVQNGYMSMPIESAGYVMRSGTYFAFRSPHYDFVMDTANLDYARNLSQPGMASPVYLTGRQSLNCLRQYSFRLEPVQSESPRADVEVIPGIGIISDRTGRSGSEMEQNVYKLMKINGASLDNYIYNFCQAKYKPGYNDDSFITNFPQNSGGGGGGYDPYDPFHEPDKEGYYTNPAAPGGNQPYANCPERSGYGYHIVQPGESLNYIARLYNLDTRSLIAWNNISDPNKIEVCDKIWLSQRSGTGVGGGPAQGARYHFVQKGENLMGIARKYNLTEANIRQLNNFPSAGNVVLQPGQRLVVSKTAGAASNTPGTTSAGNKPPTVTSPASTTGRMQYKAGRGETVASVAQKYGYTSHYFRHINRNNRYLPVNDNDILPEGMMLTVSDAKERLDFSSYVPPASAPAAYETNGGERLFYDPAPNTPTWPPSSVKQSSRFEYVGEYIVKIGDTMRSIAQQYGLSAEKLAAANNFRPGQEPNPRDILKIPR